MSNFKFNSKNNVTARVEPSTEVFKVRDGFETINSDLWDVSVGSGDLVELAGNTAGAGYLKISKSVDTENTETVLLSKFTVDSPVRVGLGMSLSQRIAHQRFSIELVGIDENGAVVSNVPVNTPVAISSVSQTTTTLTVTTATNHGLLPGDRVCVYGCTDSRMNYGEVIVATITSPTVFTVTTNAFNITIPSVTAGPFTSGFVVKVDPVNYADNALGVYWEGQSANNAKMISRTGKGPLFYNVDTSLGTNHTNATATNANGFADAFNPTYMYDIRYKAEGVIVRTMPMDTTSPAAATMKRSQVIPDIASKYKIRITARNNQGMTRAAVKIVNAVKSASSTATITTDVPHNLTTGDYVMIYGMRDQTNFANLTTATAVASIVDATTFTIAFGGSFTGNSRGGVVIEVNGSYPMAPSAQSVQSIQQTAGFMTVVGSGTWAGFAIGETVELRGLVDNSTGTVYTQYEGPYKVANISTTTLTLWAPNLADFGLINCGGAVLKRTDMRLHLFRALDYTRQTVEIDGSIGNTADYQDALPVNMVNFSTSMTSAQAAHDAVISGSPFRVAGRALSALYTTVATGDTADLVTTLVGALIQKPYSIPELDWSYAPAAAYTVTTDVVLKAAGAAGIKNYLTSLQVINTHATVATEFVIKDGATVIFRGFLPANMNGDSDYVFNTPLKTTAATALNFAAITTGANIYVNAQGYQAP